MNKAVARVDDSGNMITSMDGFEILSSASVALGGSGKYPTPGNLMVAALLNCAIGSVMGFCIKRELSVKGLSIAFDGDFDANNMKYNEVVYTVVLPENFPEKYLGSVESIINSCAVSRASKSMPAIQIKINRTE